MNEPRIENTGSNTDDKAQVYLMGSMVGMLVGFLTAYFYTRAADESGNDKGLESTDFVKLALTVLGLVRQMTELGSGKK